MAEQEQKPNNLQIRAELVGWRDRRGQFTTATDKARDDMAIGAQTAAKSMLAWLAEASPVGEYEEGKAPKTTRFAKGWRMRYRQTRDGGDVVFENVAAHAKYVLFPTKPHPIDPHGKFLRFTVRGHEVFARHVDHPGTKGNNVPAKVLRDRKSEMEHLLQTVAGRAMAGIEAVFKG